MTDDFARFKAEYPRRAGGNPWHPAEVKFERLVKAGNSAETIIAAARAYRIECEASKIIGTSYVAMAQTWLNQQRFLDHAPKPAAASDAPKLLWIPKDDPRWPAFADAWRRDHGKLPPTYPGLGGHGRHFPTPLMGTDKGPKTEAPHDMANRRAPRELDNEGHTLSVQSDLFQFADDVKPATARDTATSNKSLGTVPHRTSGRDETVSSNRDRRQFG